MVKFPSKALLAEYDAIGLDNRKAHLLFFAGIMPSDYRVLKSAPVIDGKSIVPDYELLKKRSDTK
jgi:hypothetical protein